MNYKALVLDIDGTLTTSLKTITHATKKAINKARDKGVNIVIASGRPTCGVLPIAKEINIDKSNGYILSFNGGRITNCKTGELICNKNIDKSAVPEIYDLSKEMGVTLITYSDTNVISEQENKYLDIECRICKIKPLYVQDFKKHVEFDIPKFIMLGDGEYLEKIEPIVKSRLGDRFNVFRSEPFFLEIMPKGIDKAASLEILLKHLNITRDEMIACGDGFNDVSMIKFAGLGVAMGNAQQPVKDVSNYITLSNDNDGVAYAINKFILT